MQTSYAIDQSAGLPGQLADAGHQDVVSAINSATAVPFGKLCVAGASEGLCKLPGAATDVTNKGLVLGVSVKTHAIESSLSGDPQYPVNSVPSLLRKGRIYVKVEQAVAIGDAVYVRYAAGGDGLGSFGNTAGTTERALLDGASWVKGAGIGGLAVLEVNFVA